MTCAEPLGRTFAVDRRKVVTILFADMKGSTQLGDRLEPEALRSIMTRFYATARGILERHGGTVEKFIGDAVVGVFGVPRLHEDDALRAVRAAIDFRDAVEAMNADLIERYGTGVQIRTGVNTGDVVSGDPASGEGFVSGDAVNVAARFEQAAEPGQILIGAATRALVGDRVDVELVEPLTLKGKSEPVPAFRLVAVHEGDTRRRLVAPVLGRDEERAELLRFVQEREEGDPVRVACVLGPPGIGKSRLLEDLRFALEDHARVLFAREVPGGSPLPALIREALEAGDDDMIAPSAVEELLVGREQASVIAGQVAHLLEGDAEAGAAVWAAQQILSKLAEERPLMMVVDDAHLADLDAIEDLHDAVAGATGDITLVLGARPELREDHPSWLETAEQGVRLVELVPLATSAAESIVDRLLGGSVDAGLRSKIVEGAGGNPLFLGETLRMLFEDGAIRRADGGAWEPTVPLEALKIPSTVRAVLAARIDQLPDVERAVLDAGAVLGSAFSIDAVASLTPLVDEEEIRAASDELIRRELVAEIPDRADTLRFRQALLREVVSDLMTREMAATLHEGAADHLERTTSDPRPVSEHLDRALELREELGTTLDPGFVRRTGEALIRAGQDRLAKGDGDGATSALDRAVHVLTLGEAEGLAGSRREAADLAYRLAAWDAVIGLLGTEDTDDPVVAEQLGVALTRSPDDAERLAEGRALLARAVELGAGPDAAAALAGTWKGIDDGRARQLYVQAHDMDPSHPYALGNLLEYEIAASGDLTRVERRTAAIGAAAARCAEQGEAGENLPWAWFDLGKFRLLLGEPLDALTAYATAIGRSVAGFQIATSRASLERLGTSAGEIEGLEDARRLLTLGEAVRFGSEDARAIQDLATPGAWPLAPPVVILAGGSSAAVDEQVRGYADVILSAMKGWDGSVISGGTRQGVSALAGDLGGTGARVVGYLPGSVPDSVAVDDDPRRYSELRRSDGNTFGPREPLRYWADVLASGISPASVRMIALAGGAISAFEYRLALALGARVGVIRGSGDAATDLLVRSTWSASGSVEELDPNVCSIRSFVGA